MYGYIFICIKVALKKLNTFVIKFHEKRIYNLFFFEVLFRLRFDVSKNNIKFYPIP